MDAGCPSQNRGRTRVLFGMFSDSSGIPTGTRMCSAGETDSSVQITMKLIRPTLATGVPQLGICVSYPAPGIVERIGIDWDWIWVDGQHSDQSYQETLAIVRACDLVQRPAMVRVPSHEFGGIGRALDMGATGVIVPLVDTPEQARAVVRAAKFPPLGGRSYGGRRPIDSLGRLYS